MPSVAARVLSCVALFLLHGARRTCTFATNRSRQLSRAPADELLMLSSCSSAGRIPAGCAPLPQSPCRGLPLPHPLHPRTPPPTPPTHIIARAPRSLLPHTRAPKARSRERCVAPHAMPTASTRRPATALPPTRRRMAWPPVLHAQRARHAASAQLAERSFASVCQPRLRRVAWPPQAAPKLASPHSRRAVEPRALHPCKSVANRRPQHMLHGWGAGEMRVRCG